MRRSFRVMLVAALAAAPAHAEETPTFTVTQQLALDAVKGTALAGLGAYTGGGSVVAYKTMEFLIATGQAAVAEEDRTLGAQMIRADELGRMLKDMHNAGIVLRNDRRTLGIRRELEALRSGMQSGEDGLDYAAYAIGRHPKYAVFRAGLDTALNSVIGRLFERVGLEAVVSRLGIGRAVKSSLNTRGPIAPYLRAAGWRRFGTRSTNARRITDKWIESFITAAAEKFLADNVSEIERRTREDVWLEAYRRRFPNRVPVFRDRLEIARALLPFAPPPAAAARPAEPLLVAAAAAPAAAARPVAPVVRNQTARGFDPVVEVLKSEDSLVPPHREPVMRERPQPVMESRVSWRGPSINNSWDGNGVRISGSW